MPESNHSALGQGLKIYTDAMRRLVGERLIVQFKDRWWKAGILDNLTGAQAANLSRSIEKEPSRDKLDFIDAGHFLRIVTKNFDGPLHGVFTDFRKTQSWLQQVANARNDWAHPRTGDMLTDEAAHALYAMVQILSAAGLPEAAAVEAIRRDVQGLATESAPPAAGAAATALSTRQSATVVEPASPPAPIPAPAPGQLPYWWQVCEPHDAFKDPANVDEGLFAATLGGVYAGAAREEFLQPEKFFEHTYFTENLKQTIRDVASRMRGGPGPAVTEMQTPFGGGKTHALLTLYHLINNPQRSLAVAGVREALGDVSLPENARVLVFDGQELGTEPVIKEDGASISTLWGELAYQVSPDAFLRLAAASDKRETAPGNAVFRQVLQEAAPCLILIDELVSYLIKLQFPRTEGSTERPKPHLYRQTIQFLQETLQEAGNVPGVCVLISLPKSKKEFGGLDPAQLQQELGVVEELQARADRVVSKRTPVNDDEIYTLMSKRLFKRVDTDAAARVARAYREGYERTRNFYDPVVFTADYMKNEVAAYPFHPELIDLLYKKWSTASDFPRTRAVLQLLASVVADQWKNRPPAFAIQSAHVNLERERVRTRIVSASGSGGVSDAVVAADIIGGDAHADMQDQQRGGDYQRFHIARGVATTLLMNSFGGNERIGALPADLRLGTVAPNVGPEYVSEVLESLEQRLWYVHREGDLLRFQTRINVYRMIAQRAEEQSPTTVQALLQDALTSAINAKDFEKEGFRVLPWAGSEGIIANHPTATIAVLDARYAVTGSIRVENDRQVTVVDEREAIDRLWDKVGGKFREWRNALVLVAPDKDLWSNAEAAVREVLAYESVIASAKAGGVEVSQTELKELTSKASDKRESLRTSIVTAYRWVFFPDEKGLTPVSLSVPATKDERIARRVVDRLASQDYGHPKILKALGAQYFDSLIAPRVWQDNSSPLDLQTLLRRFNEWTYLPILPDRESILRACIRQGIVQSVWAVAIGDNASMNYQQLVESPADFDTITTLFDGTASLVRAELAAMIRDDIRAKTTPPAPPSPSVDEYPPIDGGGRVIRDDDDDPDKVITPPPPTPPVQPSVIPAPKRLTRARLQIDKLGVGKTGNLQPYLFKRLQEQDAGSDITLSIEISSSSGVSSEALDKIVEAFDTLGIQVRWDPL